MNKEFQYAINEVQNVPTGSEFLVKELFKGYIWKSLPISVRKDLGRDFFKQDRNPYLADGTIQALGKNPGNQQIYKKCI